MRQSLVIGIVAGSGYGLIALGLVLVYKSTGIFNFAQGEFGTVAVFALWGAHSAGVPYVGAMLLGILAALASGLATERFVVRPLFSAPRVTLLVATAGVSLFAIGAELWIRTAPLPDHSSPRLDWSVVLMTDPEFLTGRVSAGGSSEGMSSPIR